MSMFYFSSAYGATVAVVNIVHVVFDEKPGRILRAYEHLLVGLMFLFFVLGCVMLATA